MKRSLPRILGCLLLLLLLGGNGWAGESQTPGPGNVLSLVASPSLPSGISPADALASLPPCCRQEKEASILASSPGMAVIASGASKDPEIGIDEHLGTILPLDTPFTDETGVSKPLKSWITKPTIVAFVFFRCPVVCNLVQGSVADVIKKISPKPGEDYNVLSISIDEEDNTETAKKKKFEFFNALKPGFPDSAWKFLFGTRENIHAATHAAGFFFTRVEGSIVHPAALIFVSPEGKIVRYLHGTEFLPLNVSLALTEAAEGRVGYALKSVVTFCFSYDPAGKKYVLNIVRISGITILLFVGIFLFFLLRKGESDRKQP